MQARILLLAMSLFLTTATQAEQKTFSKSSTDQQAVLVELFTSQGCSSCPPADKWLSSFEDNGYSREQVIPLALHVDYWDYIGWKDHFAQAQFGQRQSTYVQLNRAKTAYTPQIMVNGNDLRSKSSFANVVRETGQKAASAKYTVIAQLNENTLDVTVNFNKLPTATNNLNVMLAITENGLSSKINRGENDGRTLHHSHVTRLLKNIGQAQGELTTQITLAPEWNQESTSLVIFLQKTNGQILQAMQLSLFKKRIP